MSTYILFYDYVEDYLDRRGPFRPAHFEHAKAHIDRGQLLIAGAYANPADGAALVFEVEDAAVLEAFAQNDPYTQAGLVTGWSIREWTVVVGEEKLRG